MPFTPFHMGPGLLIKALLGRKFSLIVFAWAQIVMELMPFVVAQLNKRDLLARFDQIDFSGLASTYAGAAAVAVVVAVSGKYVAQTLLWLAYLGREFKPPVNVGWKVALFSALVGTFSYVLIGSFLTENMAPLYPLSADNIFLGLASLDAVRQFCIYSGLVGVALFMFMMGLTQSRRYYG